MTSTPLVNATIEDANNYEVGYFRIHDWEPLLILAPSIADDHVAHFLAIVSQQPKPVYVHCRYGENRTGVMVAAYRVIIEGVNNEEAIEEMSRIRRGGLKPTKDIFGGCYPHAVKKFGAKLWSGYRN